MVELGGGWSYDEENSIGYKNNLEAFKLVAEVEPGIDSSFTRDKVEPCMKYRLDDANRVYFGDIPLGIVHKCVEIEKENMQMNETFDTLEGFGEEISVSDNDSVEFDDLEGFAKFDGKEEEDK